MSATQTITEQSRLWVFASNRLLSEEEALEMKNEAAAFSLQWTAHKVALTAAADVLYNSFLVIGVDEDKHGASGCSIDAMHSFIRKLEKKYAISLFDRLRVIYLNVDTVQNVSLKEFEKLYANGDVDQQTLIFNSLVNTGKELADNFLVPLSQSWLARRLLN